MATLIGTALTNVRAFEAERRRAEALAEIDKAKTAFFSNVSHEFRTPLTLMLGPLEEAVSDEKENSHDRERLEIIRRNALRLLKLVNSLLDFSRTEAGRAQANVEPTDLAALTKDLASTFRSAIERAGLDYVVDCPPLPELVNVDRDMWEKIVLNLLSNAFKFTFAGQIKVQLGERDGAAVLTVSDTGTGIPANEIGKLFERFHRVEGARGRSIEGTGIGLALVQELARFHGGEIRAESVEGEGSRFEVTIPAGALRPSKENLRDDRSTSLPAGVRADAFVQEALQWLPAEASTAPSPLPLTFVPGAARILLADDNADMQAYVQRLLAGTYSVEVVGDGLAALEAIRAHKPDLLLTDVMMPKLDGFGLIQAVRGDTALQDLPIIGLSARAGEEARADGLDAGADDYLIKPFAARELVASVQSNLDLARLRRETTASLRESEARFRNMADHAPVMMWVTDENGLCTYLNRGWYEFTGQKQAEGLGGGWLDVIHPDDNDAASQTFLAANTDRLPFRFEYRLRRADGAFRWTINAGAPRFGQGGEFLGYIGSVIDITERRESEALQAADAKRLEALNRTGAALATGLDLERLVQTATDAGVELTGAQFGAFFYNVIGEAGESYMLYTLSGVPRSAFENFPMPRNTKIFAPTFTGQGVVRSDDITMDDRYGHSEPYRGMPKGHLPVKSYLAVPVASNSGEVIGGLFFGHAEPGQFTAAHEALVSGIAGQAAVALDNARLYQTAQREVEQRRKAEDELSALNAQLEQRVAEAIDQRSAAEQALRQAQKMESLGQLTGGVAHDFNNLLQVIGGNLQLLVKDIAGNDKAGRRVTNALAGVERGAKLASQLLAFGRRQPLEPKVVNIGRFVVDIEEMLRRTIGEGIQIETIRSGGLWNVSVDPVQVENAILNLAINARDAMDGHGKLTIEVGNAFLDDAYARQHEEVPAGQYVMLAVTDTGTGMSPEIVSQVFEPFFSTKPVGKGTGLGLSMVYGFVKQSGGHIKIYSELGEGTTIKLYFPRVRQNEDLIAAADIGPVKGGTETILVAEDDEEVRNTVVEMLGDLGYAVVKARDAGAALTIIESGIHIDLLFTDVVMPGPLRSPELAKQAKARQPHIAVLFTSGYTENSIVHGGRLDAGVELLSKPYTREAMARKLRSVLDQQRLENQSVTSAKSDARGMPAPNTRLRILVVEDDAIIRMNTADMISDFDHEALEAGSGTEALAILDDQPIDVMVTDLGLPGMSGENLAQEVRSRWPNIAVVFATGQSTAPDLPGPAPVALLKKPFSPEDLRKALAQVTLR